MTADGLLHPILLVASIVSSAILIWLLQPVLARYTVVPPNARSSHKIPTPQGAGIAVIAATIFPVAIAIYFFPQFASDPVRTAWILAATIALAIVGALDDLLELGALPKLLLQVLMVGVVVAALPDDLRVVPALPTWVERALIGLAILWFVNLTNFMDGIDWMTVAEVVPVAAGLALFGLAGALPREATLVAIALCGATIGFAPSNKPVAKVFLGDVGSLPIGLLLGWLLVLLAGGGHLIAALLLPLYYLADASITLLRRLANQQPIAEAHRGHFYQRAVDGNFSVPQVVGRVFALNIALIGLAATTLLTPSHLLHAAALIAGCALVGLLLYTFTPARA